VSREKKPRSFKAVTAVKALARKRIGEPRPGQVVPDRKKKKSGEKHKRTIGQLLEGE
jgi:hypothetical protein